MTSRACLVACRLLVCFWLSGASPVRAESALFVSSDARVPTLLPELTLALRSRGVLLLLRAAGEARSPLERAVAAQHVGRDLGASVAFWVEHEPPLRVRAVGTSAQRIFEAPLPGAPESVEPRVFANVASSVVLEALGLTGSLQAPLDAQPSAAPTGPRIESKVTELPWPAEAARALPSTAPARFFVRAGFTPGFGFMRKRAHLDRGPTAILAQVDAAARSVDGTVDLARARRELQAHGFDCTVAAPNDNLSISSCRAAIDTPGVARSFALDLAGGLRVTERLALALTARIAPHAGMGTLAHALLGAQLELALLEPRPKGFWLNGLAGLGVGRIQLEPSGNQGSSSPLVTSGLFNARGGLQTGYRFSRNFGLYLATVLQFGFPDRLFALDPSLGVEGRL